MTVLSLFTSRELAETYAAERRLVGIVAGVLHLLDDCFAVVQHLPEGARP